MLVFDSLLGARCLRARYLLASTKLLGFLFFREIFFLKIDDYDKE